MIYLRKNLEDGKLELNIYDDELITYCCECGKEIKLDHEDIKHLESFDSTSYALNVLRSIKNQKNRKPLSKTF